MSVSIKSAREIELMRQSCALLAQVHDELAKIVLDHIQGHIDALKNTNPDLLMLLGQQPLQQQPPQGPQGPQQPPQGQAPQGSPMAEPAPQPGQPNLPQPEGAPNLPNMPKPPGDFKNLPTNPADVPQG